MTRRIGHFISGKLTAGDCENSIELLNPATGLGSGTVCLADGKLAAAAVEAAHSALPQWAATPTPRRARIMFRFGELIRSNTEELASLISLEHGKTIADAKGEIQRGLEVVDFACGIQEFLKGSYSANVSSNVHCHDLRQPVGVCVGITPFNFPAMVPLWMFPMALSCGNTFVLKPSEKDPSCPLRLAELMQQAGLPDGVFNVINGNRDAVDALLRDDRVAAVSFVGSTKVAEYICTTATATGKRVQALGGAKNHMLVMPDAELDNVANAAIGAAYGSSGQRCMAISVAVTTDDDTADKLVSAVSAKLDKLKIGPGTDEGADMGPVVDRDALNRITSYLEQGVKEGAKLVRDGRKAKLPDEGLFIGPSLFDQVQPHMSIYADEIFGPVLCVVRAAGYEQALQIVNSHQYGNGTAIFTNDGNMAQRFCEEVQAGMVGVNVPLPVPSAFHSFGGWKQSIFGDHAIYGSEGVRFYTRLKTITSRWSASEQKTQLAFK